MLDLKTVKKVLDTLKINYSISYETDGFVYLTISSFEDNWFKFDGNNMFLY